MEATAKAILAIARAFNWIQCRPCSAQHMMNTYTKQPTAVSTNVGPSQLTYLCVHKKRPISEIDCTPGPATPHPRPSQICVKAHELPPLSAV